MKSWTLGMKLYASFALIIAIMIGLGVFTINGLQNIEKTRTLRKDLFSPATKIAGEIFSRSMQLRYQIHEFKYQKQEKFLIEARKELSELNIQSTLLVKLVENYDKSLFDHNLLTVVTSHVNDVEKALLNLESATRDFNKTNGEKHESAIKSFDSMIELAELLKASDAESTVISAQFVKDSLEIIKQLTRIRMIIYGMVDSSDPEIHNQCNERYEKIGKSFEALKAANLPKALNDKILQALANYEVFKNYNLVLKNQLTTFINVAEQAFKEILDLKNASGDLEAECHKHDEESSDKTSAILASVNYSIVVALIVISILAIFLAGYLINIITAPIRQGINAIATSTVQISATVNQLATSSAETASSIAETSTTADEIRQTAELNSSKALEVSEGSQQASETAQNGLEATESVIKGMENIKAQMQEISASILLLNEHNQMISEITETVNDLAEQSNLLAVNASIEAAKAGEQGKGFAVVAQEVRNLAEQSKTSTKQVRAILSEIQKATNKAVLVTEQGTKAVEKGKAQAESASLVIRELTQTVHAAALAATGISASSKQQQVGIEEVASSMKVVKEAANQNRLSMKQLQDSAVSLKGASAGISELIGE